MGETDVARGERLLRVRDAGDPDGRPVVYFHGTPGSRLDLTFAEDLADEMGVRLVSFDRPGYGESTAARFGLVSVAEDADGFEPLVSLCRQSSAGEIVVAFAEMQSDHDRVVMTDERVASEFGNSMKEGLRSGSHGCGWDNVAWVGPWEIDPSTINRPVFLWYGDEDRLCAPSHGFWLRDHVPGAEFVLRAGEGHAGLTEHTAEVLTALTR